MANGYFNDGAVNIELGAHVFAVPRSKRRNVTRSPHDAPAVVMDSGGGVLSLRVTAQRDRANLGDAEAYIYNQLLALGGSDAGDLGCEDNRGYRHVFGDAVCRGGGGEARGLRFADMSLDFDCPEKSAEPAWAGLPAAPGLYPGTATAQNYQAGGVTLGIAGSLSISLVRRWPLREVPRARGARTSIPHSGGALRFLVTAARVAETEHLATDVEDLIRSIGPLPVDLTGNGNTFEDVVLAGVRPRPTDARHTSVEFEFLQEIV